MTEEQLHQYLVAAIFIAAAATSVSLFFVVAPYGRHFRSGWGPAVRAKLAWVVMESPTVALFLFVYALGDSRWQTAPLALLGLWMFHYVYRTCVYPFRLARAARPMPASIIAMALLFNSINAYLNARWISQLGDYPGNWLLGAPFIAGVAVFFLGWAINQHADQVLLRLRKSGEAGYQVPHGGLYARVSCPNYLGEILEWIGWAIATWSLAGLAFAVFTAANLVPRAIANHRWYQRKFRDYPPERKAIVPYLL